MDIKIRWVPSECRGDWVIENGDIGLDSALTSAVLVSLFSDRVAPETVTTDAASAGIVGAPDAEGSNRADRRGWWGDAYNAAPIGSRLWQLARTIVANQTSVLRETEAICHEALQWLVDDGVVQSVNVAASWGQKNALIFKITIRKPGQLAAQDFLFSWAWEGIS